MTDVLVVVAAVAPGVLGLIMIAVVAVSVAWCVHAIWSRLRRER